MARRTKLRILSNNTNGITSPAVLYDIENTTEVVTFFKVEITTL